MTTTASTISAHAGGSATGNLVIQVERLSKRYGKVLAVRGIDFTVCQGEIFGLIGRDGAGKTTTFHIDVLVTDAHRGESFVRTLLDKQHVPLDTVQVAEATLENVFVTCLRQQGSDPPFISFPRSRPTSTYNSASADQKIAIGASNLKKMCSPSQIKAEQPGQLLEVVTDRTQVASDLLKTQLEPWRVSIFGEVSCTKE